MKQILRSYFGQAIQFAANPRRNEAEFVYSSSTIPSEIAIKMKNQEMKEAVPRSLMQEVDFCLSERFSDAAELK